MEVFFFWSKTIQQNIHETNLASTYDHQASLLYFFVAGPCKWTVAMPPSKAEARNTVSVCCNMIPRFSPMNSFVLDEESDNDSNSLVRSVSLYILSAPFAAMFALIDIQFSLPSILHHFTKPRAISAAK
jgi:hypothetical protein